MKETKTKKQKKPQFTALKNIFYAIKIISKCAPMLITSRIFVQISFWFFSAFVKEVLFLKMLLDLLTNKGSFKEYALLVLMFVGAELAATGINAMSNYFCSVKNKKFYKKMNDRIFQKSVSVDMACFDNPEFYDKYKRATEIITDDHCDEFAWNFANIFAAGLTGIFLTLYVISIDPKILLILLSSVIVLAVEAYKGKLMGKRSKEMTTHRRSKAYVKRTVYLRDFAKDLRTSNIFEVLHARYKNAVERNREIIKKYGIKVAILDATSALLGKAMPVATTYVYAAYRFAVKQDLAVSDFSVIMTAMSNLKDVFNDLGETISMIREEAEYFGNLRTFMEYESKVVGGTREAEELQTIEFKDVRFTYPGAENPSLDGLSIKIDKGQTVAVVGKNGAGKTTFVKLLLRFYDPDSGVILYNGRDIREYDIASLRERLATVFQDYKVFALTVGENVLCREVDGDAESQIVREALKNSGANECVDRLPEKENTVLTREFDEKGVGLSGGEQQKVATARMFAKDFDLAVLDEPSSALDPIAEYKMYESLIEATKEKTVIYISHRLSSAVLSDNVFVFENGKVSESGTHEQLMSDGKGYCEMFTLQASNYKDEERSVS